MGRGPLGPVGSRVAAWSLGFAETPLAFPREGDQRVVSEMTTLGLESTQPGSSTRDVHLASVSFETISLNTHHLQNLL